MASSIKGWLANELTFGDEANAEILSREFYDERRWEIDYRVVFKIKGQLGFYSIIISEPKTEVGEYKTYDSSDDVPVKRVLPKVVHTVVYEEVEDQDG